MSKQKDKRRKAQLASKALNESFKFQVMYALKQKATDETYDAEIIDRELDVICEKGLGQDMLKIKEMLEGVRTEMGAEHTRLSPTFWELRIRIPLRMSGLTVAFRTRSKSDSPCRLTSSTTMRCATRWLNG